MSEDLSGYSPLNTSYDPGVDPMSMRNDFIRNVDRVTPGGEFIAAAETRRISETNANDLNLYRKRMKQMRESTMFVGNRNEAIVDYNLRSESNNNATMGAVHKTMVGVGTYAAADIGWRIAKKGLIKAGVGQALTAGAGGIAAGFAIPMAVAAAPAAFFSYGVDQEIQRRQHVVNTTSDLNNYRGNLGLERGSNFELRELGKTISSYTRKGNGFFDGEELDRIHKIGLSNNMLSSKKAGSVHSGSSQQYMNNMKDLVATTEEVVKFMNTTIEQGMSIANELKKSGLHNLDEVRAVIRNSNRLGNVSGLGKDGMMKFGAMGAMASASSPYDSSVVSDIYQRNAANVGRAMSNNAATARAVKDVGGLDNAVKTISAFEQNIMSSGLGLKMAAAMMDKNGKFDIDKMKNLKNMNSAELVAAANNTGAELGEKRGMINQLAKGVMNEAATRMDMKVAAFDFFRSSKPHLSYSTMANAFVQQYGGGNLKEETFLMNNLMGPRMGIENLAASNASQFTTGAYETARYGSGRPTYGFWGKIKYDIGTGFNNIMQPIGAHASMAGGILASQYSMYGYNINKKFDSVNVALGLSTKHNRTSYEELSKRLFGDSSSMGFTEKDVDNFMNYKPNKSNKPVGNIAFTQSTLKELSKYVGDNVFDKSKLAEATDKTGVITADAKLISEKTRNYLGKKSYVKAPLESLAKNVADHLKVALTDLGVSDKAADAIIKREGSGRGGDSGTGATGAMQVTGVAFTEGKKHAKGMIKGDDKNNVLNQVLSTAVLLNASKAHFKKVGVDTTDLSLVMGANLGYGHVKTVLDAYDGVGKLTGAARGALRVNIQGTRAERLSYSDEKLVDMYMEKMQNDVGMRYEGRSMTNEERYIQTQRILSSPEAEAAFRKNKNKISKPVYDAYLNLKYRDESDDSVQSKVAANLFSQEKGLFGGPKSTNFMESYSAIMLSVPGSDGKYAEGDMVHYYKALHGKNAKITDEFKNKFNEKLAHQVRMGVNKSLNNVDVGDFASQMTAVKGDRMNLFTGDFWNTFEKLNTAGGGREGRITKDLFGGLVASSYTNEELDGKLGKANGVLYSQIVAERIKRSGVTGADGVLFSGRVDQLEAEMKKGLVGYNEKKLSVMQAAATKHLGTSSAASMTDIVAATGDASREALNAYAFDVKKDGVEINLDTFAHPGAIARAKEIQMEKSSAAIVDSMAERMSNLVKDPRAKILKANPNSLVNWFESGEFQNGTEDQARNEFIKRGGEEVLKISGYKGVEDYEDKLERRMSRRDMVNATAGSNSGTTGVGLGSEDKKRLLRTALYDLTDEKKRGSAARAVSDIIGRNIEYKGNGKFKDSAGEDLTEDKLAIVLNRFIDKMDKDETTNKGDGKEAANASHPPILGYWNNNYQL